MASKQKFRHGKKLKSQEILKRKTALDYVENIFDDFIELHGDRAFKDDKAIVCGLGKIGKSKSLR